MFSLRNKENNLNYPEYPFLSGALANTANPRKEIQSTLVISNLTGLDKKVRVISSTR